MTALETEVARNTDVDNSAIALINGLPLADSMKASSDALAAAVTANTPVEPTP
jgi:hypothetical protein